MFEAAVVAVKLMTEVPVGGVQDLHGKRLDKEKRAGARAPRDGNKMRMEPPFSTGAAPDVRFRRLGNASGTEDDR
ncbi:hypothetical protein KAM643c_12390 [Aeromonas caviae]|nr:hypothetical protein KAM643c_12390 [Aeromonas caviae]